MTFYAPRTHAPRPRDHWPTPPDLARALVLGLVQAGIELPVPIYDPCHGEGALLDALALSGFGSDLFPDEYPSRPRLLTSPVNASDPAALADALGESRSIVTNPPYGREAAGIVQASVELVQAGVALLAAFLLPLPWEAAGSPSRLALVQSPLFAARIVCCWRPEWVAGTGGGGKMNSVWLVWINDAIRRWTGQRNIYVPKTAP